MSSPSDSLSTRSMRLKVLYTFDADSKNKCLARWPQPLDLQIAFIDDQTQIGIVDLRTCLQALTTSSPELLSQEATDYTIYAVDYSEEGTPLSGQGMLSSVFNPNSDSAAAEAEAEAAPKVITGRVTRNTLALFGNGQETLEVNLRLLPVPKQVPLHPMQSPSIVQGWDGGQGQAYDTPAWPSLQRDENLSMTRQQSVSSNSPVDTTGLETMQRMLHEGSAPRETSANQSSESTRAISSSRPVSRSGTPGSSQTLGALPRQSFSHSSRPASFAVSRGTAPPVPLKRRDSFNSGYYSGEDHQVDEGPTKKRAKVMQVGAPSRSDLNIERQSESLRMVASTASSVRVHRPSAVNPALGHLQSGSMAEEPIRPPTPIPRGRKPMTRRLNSEPGGLGSRPSYQIPSLAAQSGSHSFMESMQMPATSPELGRAPSASSTPINIPSSPPPMMSHGSLPSSPMLPPPHSENDMEDSGFTSGFDDMAAGMGLDSGNLAQDRDADILQLPQSAEENATAALFDQMTTTFQSDDVGPPNPPSITSPTPPLPRTSNQPTVSGQQPPRSQSSRPAIRPGMSSPRLAPAPYPRARQLQEEMAAQPSLPPVPASDPLGRDFHRANSWAGDMSDLPTSDFAPTQEGGRPRGVSKKKVGREQTRARLENALAQNEMPPYCDNCGAIDTPAWRRVFIRTLPGNLFDSVPILPDTPRAFVWKQVVAREDDGSIKTFRAYKLSKNAEDKGEEWSYVTLCNPCGLWFHKNKCMRPEEKWGRHPKDPNQKKKRAHRPRSKRVAAKKGHDEEQPKGDAPGPGSEGSSPADGVTEAEPDVDDDGQAHNPGVVPAESHPDSGRVRSSPAAMNRHDRFTYPPPPFLVREDSRSSPVTADEGHEHPDLTPKPLRRQLFSSPTNKVSPSSQLSSERCSLIQPLVEVPNVCRRSPRLNKNAQVEGLQPRTPGSDKENRSSEKGAHDELYDLFNDDDNGFLMGPPPTPTPARRSSRLFAKTPTKTPSGNRNSARGANLSPSAIQEAHGNRTPGRNLTTGSNKAFDKSRSVSVMQQAATNSTKAHDANASLGTCTAASPCPETPKKDLILGSNGSLEEMTPFTRLIHQELSRQSHSTSPVADGSPDPGEAQTPCQRPDPDSAHPSAQAEVSPISRHVASLDMIDFNFLESEVSDMFRDNPSALNSSPGGLYSFLNSDCLDPGTNEMSWLDGEEAVGMSDKPDFAAVQPTTKLRRSPRKNKLESGRV